ncbi:UNVERIFIED_CONTAM: Ribonuclease 1 [Sesamum radiatum]|uniref:Ribonuclease 1 n=1 Tax=Sesamum radiatum TaxID=300843 RepID=A0AAW2TVX9_SESRA
MMNPKSSVLAKLLWLMGLAVVCTCQDFDFFYFVQQWPGSYCDSKRSCCYPKTGKPASDFSIHGLWPNYNDGSYPSNCESENQFDPSKISDLSRRMQTDWPSLECPSSDSLSFWAHEWDKHGTCSQSVLDQHDYFATALNLKQQLNLLQILGDAGIEPNGEAYSLSSIKDAIKGGSGYEAWIECNSDESGNRQLYQVYMCLDASASNIIDCPVFPHGKCTTTIEFPPF